MQHEELAIIAFSPTGATGAVLKAMAQGYSAAQTRRLDLTRPRFDYSTTITNCTAIIGCPVYAGRVPLLAAQRLEQIAARNIPAALVVTYGNRAVDDALAELFDLASAAGFIPLAGAAFIGEHSFATQDAPIAMGRPDAADLAKAETFSAAFRAHVEGVTDIAAAPRVKLPGNRPYKERPPRAPLAPETDTDRCILCGACASVCPAKAIVVDDAVVTDADLCVRCCACVKNCPESARQLKAEKVDEIRRKLMADCGQRKEPELFW